MAADKIFFLLLTLLASSAFAQVSAQTPMIFIRDVQRHARWLPADVNQYGIELAYERRWVLLPVDVQEALRQARIPAWMIALVPTDGSKQGEIMKQLRALNDLAGTPSPSVIGARAEQLLFFSGAAQLPTPGDAINGNSLGAEGCTAAMSHYVLAQLKLEFPEQLATMPDALTRSQSSGEMNRLFAQLAREPWVSVRRVDFARLQLGDVGPGSLMIAQKPGGTHVFGWTRVPAFWNWDAPDMMAVGNTGLAQFGDRMILAQEFLTDRPGDIDEFSHNEHGPLNSHRVIRAGGRAVLEDPRTNVYGVKGAEFVIVSFR